MNPLTSKKGNASLPSYDWKEGTPSSIPARGALGDGDKGSGSRAQVMQHEGAVKVGSGTGPAKAKLGDAENGGKGVGNAPATKVAGAEVQNAMAENPIRNRPKPWK